MKAFGFCDFMSAEGILMALKVLSELHLLGKKLTLRVDEKATDYLDRFKDFRASRGIPVDV